MTTPEGDPAADIEVGSKTPEEYYLRLYGFAVLARTAKLGWGEEFRPEDSPRVSVFGHDAIPEHLTPGVVVREALDDGTRTTVFRRIHSYHEQLRLAGMGEEPLDVIPDDGITRDELGLAEDDPNANSVPAQMTVSKVGSDGEILDKEVFVTGGSRLGWQKVTP